MSIHIMPYEDLCWSLPAIDRAFSRHRAAIEWAKNSLLALRVTVEKTVLDSDGAPVVREQPFDGDPVYETQITYTYAPRAGQDKCREVSRMQEAMAALGDARLTEAAATYAAARADYIAAGKALTDQRPRKIAKAKAIAAMEETDACTTEAWRELVQLENELEAKGLAAHKAGVDLQQKFAGLREAAPHRWHHSEPQTWPEYVELVQQGVRQLQELGLYTSEFEPLATPKKRAN